MSEITIARCHFCGGYMEESKFKQVDLRTGADKVTPVLSCEECLEKMKSGKLRSGMSARTPLRLPNSVNR